MAALDRTLLGPYYYDKTYNQQTPINYGKV